MNLIMEYFYLYIPAILGGLSGLVLLYGRWKHICGHNSESKFLPPEASGGLPIIGHLHLLDAEPTLARTLAVIADKYGPVFTIRLGMFRTLVVSNHEAVKECLTTNDRILATRPISNAGKYITCDAGFGFAPYGAYWREMRKLAVVKLLSNHRLEALKHVRISEVNAFIKNLYLSCKKKQQNPHQNILIGQKLEILTLNLILRIIAGKRYFIDADGEDDDEAQRVMKLSKEFSFLLGVNSISEVVPFMKWMDNWTWQVKSMKRISKEMGSLIESWIDEHKLNRLKSGPNYNDQDYIDILLSAIKDDSMFGHTREKIIKATAMTLIAAGSDSTSVTITWVLSNLMSNTFALKRAQEELDVKIGRDRWVEDSDINELVYLQAIIKETFRLYPPAPLGVPHEAMEDCRVSGYHIPKGTRIYMNLWKLQRDPRVWSNPEEFNPERFLSNHGKVDILGQNFEIIPFGSGRRSCPGMYWALQVIRLTVARLLQGFDIKTPTNTPMDMTEGPGATMPMATPLEVVLTPRLPDHLYQLQL